VQNGEKAKPEESSGRKPGESPNGKGQGDESAKKGDSAEKDDDKKEKEKPVDPATKRRRIIIGVGVGIVVLIAGIAWWLYSRTYESTDDAQINGHLNAIASRVAGTVKAVYVENDQPVKAGQTLVDLDPSDYEVLVAQARAAMSKLSLSRPPKIPMFRSR
jgi:membrane fusion protein, multidrug efflux system